jgi:DNA-binding NarL/FixJ family response regulator
MSEKAGPVRLLIVDDQTLFASSLKVVLEGHGKEGFAVLGIAKDGKECLALVESSRPDLILMDVRMPVMDGVEATRIVKQRWPEVKVMMLTTFDDDSYVSQALAAGATGYMLKNIEPEELIDCIHALMRGTMIVSASVGYKFFSQSQEGIKAAAGQDTETGRRIAALQARFPDLKKREAEVLLLVLKGMSNYQISQTLFIAEQTVKNYTSMIYTKIGVEGRLYAIQLLKEIVH